MRQEQTRFKDKLDHEKKDNELLKKDIELLNEKKDNELLKAEVQKLKLRLSESFTEDTASVRRSPGFL